MQIQETFHPLSLKSTSIIWSSQISVTSTKKSSPHQNKKHHHHSTKQNTHNSPQLEHQFHTISPCFVHYLCWLNDRKTCWISRLVVYWKLSPGPCCKNQGESKGSEQWNTFDRLYPPFLFEQWCWACTCVCAKEIITMDRGQLRLVLE